MLFSRLLPNRWTSPRAQSKRQGQSARRDHADVPWRPRIRCLEPRIVLNASAEIGLLGELAISGDGAADLINVDTLPTGEVQLRGGDGEIIPIRTGVDAMGDPIFADSIAVAAIPAGRMTIDMGAGDDHVNLEIPDTLDVTLVDGLGQDTVTVDWEGGTNEDTIQIEAEMIRLRGGTLDARGDDVSLTGNVSIPNDTKLLLGDGQLSVDGNLTLQSDLDIRLNDGLLDLVEANVSATTEGHRLVVDGNENSIVQLGQFSDQSGSLVGDVSLTQFEQLQIDAPEWEIGGALLVDSVDMTTLDGQLTADEIRVQSTSLDIRGASLISTDGDIDIVTMDDLEIHRLDAGLFRVQIDANSVQDASGVDGTANSEMDILAQSVHLQAADGIGHLRPLELLDPQSIHAVTVAGGIGLNVNAAKEVAIAQVRSDQGDIQIESTGGGNLLVDSLQAEDGTIELIGDADIVLDDFDPTNNSNLTDPQTEISARGINGSVLIDAGGDFIAADGVQIFASSVDPGSVMIEAKQGIELGEDFQIQTGGTGEGGTARLFSPRPDPIDVRLEAVPTDPVTGEPLFELPDTAFFDYESIRTNILSQFGVNDAAGILSVDIGAPGESGLTLMIDWGGPTERFQRIDDLAGDRTTVNVSHVYTESEILDSRLNGRRSATDPLEVRFAVSHHESIVLNADRITQANSFAPGIPGQSETITEIVDGRLISSTDNPQTGTLGVPVLENGAAQFVIPRVDVPVAFFPVRDVIPEPIEPARPVILESVIVLGDASVSTTEASSSGFSIRQEFFQLRVLSPDPEGEDLIEPVRLPQSILSGERLEGFLNDLPDGAYEIEYVLGDGDERSILQFDLRDGKPIIIDDDLEAGTLRLTPLDFNLEQRSAEHLDADQPNGSTGPEQKHSEPEQGHPDASESDHEKVNQPGQDDTSANSPFLRGDAVTFPTAIATAVSPLGLSPGSRLLRRWHRRHRLGTH